MREKKQRVDDLLKIRIDGAQAWDAVDFVRSRESGEEAADPWKLDEGEKPLSEARIAALLAEADRLILESVRSDPSEMVARQIVQRRNLYARALQNGELSVALGCLRDEAALLGLYPTRTNSVLTHESRLAEIAVAIEGTGAQAGAGQPGAEGTEGSRSVPEVTGGELRGPEEERGGTPT